MAVDDIADIVPLLACKVYSKVNGVGNFERLKGHLSPVGRLKQANNKTCAGVCIVKLNVAYGQTQV